LEHLGISIFYYLELEEGDVVNIPNLVALHQFKQLSSLEITIESNDFNDFHEVIESELDYPLNNLFFSLSKIRCTALAVNERTLLFWKS
jgi:hypothetical protein